ncbi:MAG: hypothetical protein ACRDH9_04385 [Actinomycetota bacterium]
MPATAISPTGEARSPRILATTRVLVMLSITIASMGLPRPADAAAPFGGVVVQVNSDATTQLQNETSIAINPTDPRNLVGGSITFETGGGQCGAYASTDRGKTWTHQVLPNAPTFTNAGDPVVAFDANGTAYYLCMEVQPGPRAQYVWRSTDGGQNWLGPALAMGTPNSTDDDKGHMAVDDYAGSPHSGNVYVAATRAPCGVGDVIFSRSTTGGTSFSNEQQVNDGGVISFAANVAVGADGAVYVAWRDMTACGPGQSTNGILVDKSTDGGVSFGGLAGGTDHTVRSGPITDGVRPDANRGNGNPVLGAHPTNPSMVYAAWAEDPVGADDSDIFFARSLDGGNTWSAPLKVNDDVNPGGEFFSQFWPWMSVDPVTGAIDMIWYSDQNDPNRTDGTPLVDVYFATSNDDGVSFSPNKRVTPASFTMGGFFGDYIGIDSLGGVAHPIWADTNLGGEGDQDVATTQIGGANLSITKTDSVDPVVAGEDLTYTLTATNAGPADAFNVFVGDPIPSGTSYVSNTGSCFLEFPGLLTCPMGDLISGAGASVDVTVNVDRDLVYEAGGPTSIENAAGVKSDQDDPDSSDNIDTEFTQVVAEADLSVTAFEAQSPPAELGVGDSVPVMLRTSLTNGGPSGPTDVEVSTTGAASGTGTITPGSSSSSETAVDVGDARDEDHEYTIGCSGPGTATFDFTTLIDPTTPGTTDPDMSDNSEAEQFSVECIMPVKINVKPGSLLNPINSGSKGVIPVAVLTTAAGEYGLPQAFDATTVDALSVRFGPKDVVNAGGGAPETHGKGHPEDSLEPDEVSRDGDIDLVLHFRTQETELAAGDTMACVRGQFLGPANQILTFMGCDVVQVS